MKTNAHPVFASLLILVLFLAPGLCSADIRLGDPAVNLSDPAIAVGSDGLLRVVWVTNVADVDQVMWASFTTTGELIDGPVQIPGNGYSNSKPRIDLNAQDESHIVWQSGVSGGRIYFSRLSATGVIETAPVTFFTDGGQYSVPDLATDPVTGYTHVTARRVGPSLFFIQYALVSADGSLLAEHTPADDDISLYPDKQPAITLTPSRQAQVAYQDNAGWLWPTPGFYVAAFSSSGSELGASEIADTQYAYPLDIVYGSAGQRWIFYQKSGSGTPHIYRLAGDTEVLASPGVGPSRAPRCAASDGQPLFMVWEEASPPQSRILAQQWSAEGICVADTLTVSTSPATADQPDIATDGDGRYFVVWRDMRDGLPAVYLATLPPAGLDVHVFSARSGSPVPQAKVMLQIDGVPFVQAESDAEGVCRFRDHDVTEVVASAEFLGRYSDIPSRFDFPHDRVDSVAVYVPTDIEISGRFLDAHNALPIPDYQVALLDDRKQTVFVTNSRTDGRFFVYAEQPGNYSVAATKRAQVGTGGVEPLYPDLTSGPHAMSEIAPVLDLGTFDQPSQLVILVHGIKSSSSIWQGEGRLASVLRDRGWTVMDNLDLPGQLLTLPIYGMASVSEQARELQRVTENLAVPSFHVVAHSQGGLVTRYLAERLEAGRTPHIDRLITLATPHHGSPLATSLAFWVRMLSAAVPSSYGSLQLPNMLSVIEQDYPATVDLRPNSKFLRLLNQGYEQTGDWSGFCFDTPAREQGLRAEIDYLAVSGSDHSGVLYEGMHALMKTWSCLTSDGIVPRLSAILQNDSDGNVWNEPWPDVHHKATHIYADPDLLDWIADCLETPFEQWSSPNDKPQDKDVRSGDWTLATITDLAVPVSGGGLIELTVDACDTMSIDWFWFDGDVDLTLQTPSSVTVDSAYTAVTPGIDYIRLPQDRIGRYVIASPEPGDWSVIGHAVEATTEQNVVVWQMIEDGLSVVLALEPETSAPFSRHAARVTVTDAAQQAVTGAVVTADVSLAGGGEVTVDLFDDGVDPDAVTADGVYCGWIVPDEAAGITTIDVTASGTAPEVFSRRLLGSIQTGSVADIQIDDPGLTGTSATGLLGSRIPLSASIRNAGALATDVELSLWRDDVNLRLQTDTLTITAGGIHDYENSYMPLQQGTMVFRLTVTPLGLTDGDWSSNVAIHEVPVGPAASSAPDPSDPESGGDTGHAAGYAVQFLRTYPNPFNPAVEVEFVLRRAGVVAMEIYDLRGRRVMAQQTQELSAGRQTLQWNGRDRRDRTMPSGVYFVCLRAGEDEAVRKVLLIR